MCQKVGPEGSAVSLHARGSAVETAGTGPSEVTKMFADLSPSA